MIKHKRAGWSRAVVAAAVAGLALSSGQGATGLIAGQHEEHAPPTAFTGPIDLYKAGLGPFTRKISSQNREAQAFFNQGFQLTYAFAKPEAVRSFREAETHDPVCAICYWGEAWAWGSDLNWPMGEAEAPFAYAAIQKAMSLAETYASPNERAFIQAMAVRYVEHFDPAKRVEQDRAYADAMKKVVDAYPDDLDAATLYAEALFLLEPRHGPRDINSPNVQRIVNVLERAREGRHPPPRRLSFLHSHHRDDERTGAGDCVRRSHRLDHPRGQPHQPYAGAYLDAGRTMGRRRAGESQRLAFRSESRLWRGDRDLSLARPRDAGIRGVRWMVKARSRSKPAATTPG